jgi:hypothetical protein
MLIKDREHRCQSVREARMVLDRALAEAGVHNTREQLKDFFSAPRATVEALYRRTGGSGPQVIRADAPPPRVTDRRNEVTRSRRETAPRDDDPVRPVSETGGEIDERLGNGPLARDAGQPPRPPARWRSIAVTVASFLLVALAGVVGANWDRITMRFKPAGSTSSPEKPTGVTKLDSTGKQTIAPPSDPPRLVRLAVELDPPDATLRLDGSRVATDAKGRADFSVKPRVHQLSASAANYQTWQQSVVIQPGRDTVLFARLKPVPPATSPQPPEPAQLIVHSKTPGLEVWIDGSHVGRAEEPVRLDAGAESRRIDYRAEGFLDQTEQHAFTPGEHLERSITLTSKPVEHALLLVTLTGSEGTDNGEIWVDGVDSGNSAPGSVPVTTGRHRVQVKKRGFVMLGGDEGVFVDVLSTGESTVNIRLVRGR